MSGWPYHEVPLRDWRGFRITAADIGDPDLAIAWLELETAYEEFERLRAVVAKSLGMEE